MISFIVIGRNEGGKLSRCLESIARAASGACLKAFEVIYVDSNSSDDSVSRAKEFPYVRIYRISGECNAAVARNIGARESIGDILFFVDGDMEISVDFLPHVLADGELTHDCVTGNLLHIVHDGKGNKLGERPDPSCGGAQKQEEIKTGWGIFIIKRSAWGKVGGMRSKFRRNEDIDLTVRLAKLGIKTIRVPHLVANHYTVEYADEDRIWETVLHNYYVFPPMLFRDHIFVGYSWVRALRQNYTAFILLSVLVFAFFEGGMLIGLSAYFLSILLRVLMSSRNIVIRGRVGVYTLQRLIVQVVQDSTFWLAFLLFHPSDVEERYESA